MAVGTAFKAFFSSLFNKEVSARVAAALNSTQDAPTPTGPQAEAKPTPPPKPTRSEALTLLATLQREARFVDFIQENLDGYQDAQVGAAVRDVHRDCGKILERLFALKPILDQEEGSNVDIPSDVDVDRYRLVGNVTDDAAKSGTLMHHGWEAGKCELPKWTGSESSANVVSAAEVEVK